jgi:hypothetical protein
LGEKKKNEQTLRSMSNVLVNSPRFFNSSLGGQAVNPSGKGSDSVWGVSYGCC